MRYNTPSKTAELAALVRSSAEHIPFLNSIVCDQYAKYFVSYRIFLVSIYYRRLKNIKKISNWSKGVLSIGCLFPLCRHRFFNDIQVNSLKKHIKQVVIIAAGYDTSSMRLYNSQHAIRLFELDHPATQARKKKLIKKYKLPMHEFVTYIPYDIYKDDIVNQLFKYKFNTSQKTLIIAEGLLSYLERDCINNFLEKLTKLSNDIVCSFDYRFPSLILSKKNDSVGS